MPNREIELISAKFAELSRLMAQQEAKNEATRFIMFSQKELSKMGKRVRNQITIDGNKIPYDIRYNGCLRIRRQINKIKIEVCGATAESLKRNYLARLAEVLDQINGTQTAQIAPTKAKPPKGAILLKDYSQEWLIAKKTTVKTSTFAEYERLQTQTIDPELGDYLLKDITRSIIQQFINRLAEEGKGRTIQKVVLQLKCIFDMAMVDFGIDSPMRKLEIPYHEKKETPPLTIEAERKVVEYCKTHSDLPVCSAMLVQLYFGLRCSELQSIHVEDEMLCYTPSKERKGRTVREIQIPFTPIFKRVLQFVNFTAVRTLNVRSIQSALNRIFVEDEHHHPHEFRSTAISRWKECGVNLEVVMLWDGHKDDKQVASSKVDRRYTKYSIDYIKKESEKVDYNL